MGNKNKGTNIEQLHNASFSHIILELPLWLPTAIRSKLTYVIQLRPLFLIYQSSLSLSLLSDESQVKDDKIKSLLKSPT